MTLQSSPSKPTTEKDHAKPDADAPRHELEERVQTKFQAAGIALTPQWWMLIQILLSAITEWIQQRGAAPKS
jgi:hypothetical protein